MQAFRDRRVQVAGVAGAGLTMAALLALEVQSRASIPAPTIHQRIAELQSTMPADQADGSILESVEFDGAHLVLHFQADERLTLNHLRDDGRSEKCATWRGEFRRGQVSQVEYRYRQDGATSSLHLDRTVCG